MISLTQQERDKFAQYLEDEVKSSLEMITQLNSLNMGAANEAFTKLWKTEAAAMTIVAKRLRSIESVTT